MCRVFDIRADFVREKQNSSRCMNTMRSITGHKHHHALAGYNQISSSHKRKISLTVEAPLPLNNRQHSKRNTGDYHIPLTAFTVTRQFSTLPRFYWPDQFCYSPAVDYSRPSDKYIENVLSAGNFSMDHCRSFRVGGLIDWLTEWRLTALHSRLIRDYCCRHRRWCFLLLDGRRSLHNDRPERHHQHDKSAAISTIHTANGRSSSSGMSVRID